MNTNKQFKPILLQSHWIYGLVSLMELFLALIILAIFLILSPLITDNSIISTEHILGFSLTFILFSFALFTRGIFQWKYTYYVITPKKVLTIKITRGLSFSFQEASLDLVKNLEEEKPGLLSIILNYGHIKLTSDPVLLNEIFYMRFIKDSEKVVQKLEELITQTRSA